MAAAAAAAASAAASAATRPILYYTLFSPPSRACLLTSKVLGLNLDLKALNWAKKENQSDWFLKINPRHTVPVLVDKGVSICDSHAIATYMISQYGSDHHEHLYPRDLIKRAIVDERLYYENGVLSQALKDFVVKILRGDDISYGRHSVNLTNDAYASLEEFLAGGPYVAGGEQMTVADISINATLVTLHKLVPVDEKRYPRTVAWARRMRKELPDYEEINEKGALQLYQRFQEALENNMTRT